MVDTHQYYAFPPTNTLSPDEILDHVCNMTQQLKSSDIPQTVVGEWSLETGTLPQQVTDGGYSRGRPNRAKRTWFRLLFESQLAAYSANAGQSDNRHNTGWFYWTWKTEWDIDTWSYRRGVKDGYIPGDISNSSMLVYPIMQNGCVDRTFDYEAPERPGGATKSSGVEKRIAIMMVIMSCLLAYTL